MTVNGSYYLLTFSEPASRNFTNSQITFTFNFVPKYDYKKKHSLFKSYCQETVNIGNQDFRKTNNQEFCVIFQKIDEKEDING